MAAIAMGSGAPIAQAETYGRNTGEAPVDFAIRSLQLKAADDINVVEAKWNGRPCIFADYLRGSEDEGERRVVAFERVADSTYRKIDVTVGEQEGGAPDVKAIGFANADRDAAEELIVILAWPQSHYDVRGALYEVRILDDAKVGQAKLAALASVASHFGHHVCDCEWRGGKRQGFRFKTIAAVKAELRRLGH